MDDNRRHRIGRRGSDHDKESAIRDYMYLAERVVAERLNCKPDELVDAMQGLIRSHRRWKDWKRWFGNSLSGALMLSFVGMVAAIITILWRHLTKQ